MTKTYKEYNRDIKKHLHIPIFNTVFGRHSVHEAVVTESKGDDVESLHKKLAVHYHFNDKEHEAIEDHTDDSYDNNKAVQRGETNPQIKTMMRVVSKHKTPQAMTVYSGANKSPEHILKEGEKNDDGSVTTKTDRFTSTSLSKKKAHEFATHDSDSEHNHLYGEDVRHVLRIHVPKGHSGAYVGHHSVVPEEKEFLMKPGTKLNIHPHPTYDHEIHSMVWDAHAHE